MTTEYLLNREVQHVLAALMPANRLVCEVILHTGLRVSDVLSLKTSELRPIFYITESKTGKRRRVGLPGDLLARLRQQAGRVYVFEGRDGENTHRTRQTVWADVKRAQWAFRLPQNVGPHSLRKNYAVELMHKYGDIQRVRRALNHDRATTTMIYAIADQLLAEKLRKKEAARQKRIDKRRKV